MQYTEAKETQLVKQAAVGDEGAFAELVRACENTLYAAAMAITRNPQDALDAVQEGILKGWRKLPALREQAYFKTWMTRIVIRTAIDIRRKAKPTGAFPEDVPYSDQGSDERLDVRRAVNALDEKTRICTVLFYFEDMAVDDIARALGIRAGTVKSRLHRARAQLKQALEDYRDDK